MRKWSCLVFALLLAVPAVAQDVISAGDDGWTTPGGGGTQVNLNSFPVAQVLGSAPVNANVSLKGKPLDQANLGSIDTLIKRSSNITLTSGSGSGPLNIVALSLESEGDVVLQDGRRFRLRVCLSDSASSRGGIYLQRTNSDGGTFNSTLPILPKLVFTPVGGGSSVTIDCGTGACSEMTMLSANSAWVNTGGAGSFSPSKKGVTPIRSGINVDADCDGVKDDYTTVGKGSGKQLHAGFTPNAPSFDAVGIGEQHEDLSWHQALPPLDCANTTSDTEPTATTGAATSIGTEPVQPALCPVVAQPTDPEV